MITFENVTKTYPDGTTAVENLDLTIDEGSFTVFVGPSGCGKTTTMRMINKMVEPTSGTIRVDGKDIAGVPAVQLRLGIGYVIQNAGLFPHLSVLDNVASVLRLKGVPKAQAREQARAAIERVRLLPQLVNRYPAQLSGGQQQRVGVARALAADPPILLMDEPFSAIDPVIRDELQQEMLRLHAELGKTIVFVTHDIDEALLLGDRIAVFAPGGGVRQYADAETVLTRPADDLVATMVGRDRGFRALQFRTADGVPIRALPTPDGDGVVRLGEWSLLLADGRPVGWRGADGVDVPIGTLASSTGSLRRSLDSVLSSPARIGVLAGLDGRAEGLLEWADVLAAVETPRGTP